MISRLTEVAFADYRSLYTDEAFEVTVPPSQAIVERMREGPVWLALIDGDPCGTLSSFLTEGACWIRGMAVLPPARRRGVAWKLLETAERFAADECRTTRLRLSTTPFLKRAIALYEKYGFCKIEEGPSDLHGTPLFTMEKILTCASA